MTGPTELVKISQESATVSQSQSQSQSQLKSVRGGRSQAESVGPVRVSWRQILAENLILGLICA